METKLPLPFPTVLRAQTQAQPEGFAKKQNKTCSSVHLGKQRKPYSFLLQTVWDACVPLGLYPVFSSASDLVLNWFKVWRKASEERMFRVLKSWSHPEAPRPKDLYGHQRAITPVCVQKAAPKNNSSKLHLMCSWMVDAEVCLCVRACR